MRTSDIRIPRLWLPVLSMLAAGTLVAPAAGQAAVTVEVTPAAGQAAPTAENATATREAAPQEPDLTRVSTGDRTIEVGESVDAAVVVNGNLRVRGEVTGDAVVLNGDLILEESGLILGDALVTGGRIVNQGGRVRGEMRTVDSGPGGSAGIVDRAVGGGASVEAGSRRDGPQAEVRIDLGRDRGDRAFGSIRRGIAGAISTIALGLVLAAIGAALVFYARPYLETVSDTVRASTLRAGATGLAATFLVVPVFVVMVVAFAVSIVGIPLLILAVPLYPVALFAAGVFGLLGVTHAIGERTAEQSRDVLDLRYRNSYAYLFTGLGMLLLPLIAAYFISMTGFLSFVGIILRVVTWLAIWVATTVGFGAVILSRAGRRRAYATAAPDMGGYDADDLFADVPIEGDDHA